MPFLALVFVLFAVPDTAAVLEERIDLFDPTTGAYLGTEQTFFGADGRRLRVEIAEGDGARTLLLLHDADGREAGPVASPRRCAYLLPTCPGGGQPPRCRPAPRSTNPWSVLWKPSFACPGC